MAKTNSAATENVSGQKPKRQVNKAAKPKAAQVSGIEETYVVASRGYKETFTSREAAKQQFETLKKRSIKNKQTAKISLSSKHIDNEKDVVLEELKIDKDFFDEEDD